MPQKCGPGNEKLRWSSSFSLFPMGKQSRIYAVGHPHKLKLELQPRMSPLNGIRLTSPLSLFPPVNQFVKFSA
jgi:hypothetical protein